MFDLPQGKSLSLICGALTWLKDHEERQRKEVQAILDDQNDTQKQGWDKASDSELKGILWDFFIFTLEQIMS